MYIYIYIYIYIYYIYIYILYIYIYMTFLDLDIKIEDGIFVHKLFDKRDTFFIVRMPPFDSNIPSTIFYGSIFS